MRVLVGSVYVGESKRYALDTFRRMARRVLAERADVVVAVDQLGRTGLSEFTFKCPDPGIFATTIVEHGKNALRDYALEKEYDVLVWQGIDMFYDSRDDFSLLLDSIVPDKRPVISALQAGRARPDYAVCREFAPPGSTHQRDIPKLLLGDAIALDQMIRVRGYPGSDATAIHKTALETVTMDGYEPWVARRSWDEHALGPEEFWCWSAVNRHDIDPRVHAAVRTWHAHEDFTAARYPGESLPLDEVGARW